MEESEGSGRDCGRLEEGREEQGMEVAGKIMVPRWKSRIQPHFASLDIYNIELIN